MLIVPIVSSGQELIIFSFCCQEVNMILAILAAILHITDITFDTDYDTDGVYIIHEEMLELGRQHR